MIDPSGPASTPLSGDSLQVRILCTSDLHMHLLPYDYYLDRPAPDIGLARTATMIATLRGQVDNCILLDNGDLVQGTPASDHFATGREPKTHPAIAALNHLGYDAAGLGNHEFNYGLAALGAILGPARFPVVCANIVPSDHLPQVTPWVMLERQMRTTTGQEVTLRLGIIGFVPPQVTDWERLNGSDGPQGQDIVQAARAHLPNLKQAGVDVVIALCHSGIDGSVAWDGMENAAVPLAALDGIDAVIAGHTHQVFPGPDIEATAAIDPVRGTLHGKPAVMPGFHGSHLGVIDLRLGTAPNGGWVVINGRSRAEPVAVGTPADDGLTTLAAPAHARTLELIREPLGTLAHGMHSYFAHARPDPCMDYVNAAQMAYFAPLLAGAGYAGMAVLAAAAPFRAGGRSGPDNYTDIPAGPVTFRNACELHPFPNDALALRTTGRVVRDWLERSACVFNQIVTGAADQPLLNPNEAGYVFDSMGGLAYDIRLDHPARFTADGQRTGNGQRIGTITYTGGPRAGDTLGPDDTVIVLTNSYRAAGGGGFSMLGGVDVALDPRAQTRDILCNFMQQGGQVTDAARALWRFAPQAGTSAQFDSSPAARRALREQPGHGLRDIGPSVGGFWRFAVDL